MACSFSVRPPVAPAPQCPSRPAQLLDEAVQEGFLALDVGAVVGGLGAVDLNALLPEDLLQDPQQRRPVVFSEGERNGRRTRRACGHETPPWVQPLSRVKRSNPPRSLMSQTPCRTCSELCRGPAPDSLSAPIATLV